MTTANDIQALYEMPFFSLIHKAHQEHQQHNDPQEVECCTLLNIKTGRCPENCSYCPQSAHYNTGLKDEKLMDVSAVEKAVMDAKNNGATRFCMGAAWRSPPKKDFPKLIEMIRVIKEAGLESCMTLGMLTAEEAQSLSEAGLDYYNHNLDTSPEFYKKIITTRDYQDRLNTLSNIHRAGMKTCCGGIIGMGESREDRIQFLLALLQLESPPESIPLNQLIPVSGTPLESTPKIDSIEFIRTVAVTRLLFPHAKIRLSAGRESMSDEMQAFCFYAGANSIHFGEKLLTTKNASVERDKALFEKLGINTKTC